MKNIAVLCLILIFGAVSCATMQKGPSADLHETVKRYYDLKKEGLYSEAWSYERMATDDNEARRESSKRTYVSRSGAIRLKGYEIVKVGDEGSGLHGLTPVRIRLISEWPPLPFETPKGDNFNEFDDLWDKIDGKWYHVVVGATKLW